MSTIDTLIKQGLSWEAVLYCDRAGPTVVLSDCDAAGRAIRGTEKVALLATTGDPMWQAQGESAPRYIGEFTPDHRLHLFRFMLRRAETAAFAVTLGWSSGPLAPMGEMACDAMEAEQHWTWDHPKTWLIGTPFMRALAALIIGDGNASLLAAAIYVAEDSERQKEREW